MNYEELQDDEVRRKATNYVRWIEEVSHYRRQLASAESVVKNIRESLDRLLSMTEEGRQDYQAWRHSDLTKT